MLRPGARLGEDQGRLQGAARFQGGARGEQGEGVGAAEVRGRQGAQEGRQRGAECGRQGPCEEGPADVEDFAYGDAGLEPQLTWLPC